MKKKLCLFLTAITIMGSLCGCAKQDSKSSSASGTTPVVLNEVAHSIF